MATTHTYTIPSLSHLSSAISTVTTPQLHPVLLPISPLTLIHALRVSVGTTQVQGGKKTGLLQSVVLDLILLFGGWSVLNLILAEANPLIDAGNQWVALVYGGVHALACVTGINGVLVSLLQTKDVGLLLDLVLTFVDGVCRMDGIAQLGVEPVRKHPAPLTPLLTSILIGGGGPLLIGLFNLNNPSDWRLRTPTWLTNPTGLLAFDIWSSAFVGWVYITLSRVSATTGTSILSQKEASLASTFILILLMAANRVRAEVEQRRRVVVKDKDKKRSGSSKSSTAPASQTNILVYLGLFIPMALVILQIVLAGNTLSSSGYETPTSILLLLSHPDDEVMFFSPIITTLLSTPSVRTLQALSLSNGNAPPDYLGNVRTEEFSNSWTMLAADSHVSVTATALNDDKLQDGMDVHWESQDVVRAVLGSTTTHTPIDWIITFDDGGVSNHPNHISLSHAVVEVAQSLNQSTTPRIFTLPTYPLALKYTSLPGAIMRHLTADKQQCVSTLMSPAQYLRTIHVMKQAHRSQWVWFRYLWFVFSAYVWGGIVCEVRV